MKYLFKYLNTDDNANAEAEMLMPRFPNGLIGIIFYIKVMKSSPDVEVRINLQFKNKSSVF